MSLILERALFVVGPRNCGKSTLLRSMFLDQRLGRNGVIPSTVKEKKLKNIYYLGNDRRLYLRLTSPHENEENMKQFIAKSKNTMLNGRWCFAGALQPAKFNNMPDVVRSVRYFNNVFKPERIRVIFPSPNHLEIGFSKFIAGRDLSAELLQIERVEVACIDARNMKANGLFLADFFDFT